LPDVVSTGGGKTAFNAERVFAIEEAGDYLQLDGY